MTTKKKAQGGARSNVRGQLKARAAEIVEDVRGYDADTRRAVWVALENMKFAETNPQPPTEYTDAGFCERELRGVIEKAEKGVPAFDVESFKPETVAQARAVYACIDGEPDLPDFISGAVWVALHATAARYDVDIWLDVDGSGDAEKGGLSVAAIAILCERVGASSGVEVEPKRDLAGLISAVLKHPDTPRDLYSAMRQELARLTEPCAVNEDPAVIAVALAVHEAEAEEEGARQ